MERSKKGNYTKTSFLNYQIFEIEELILAGDIKKAQNTINKLIGEYPNDYKLLKFQAQIYTIYKMYEDAYNIYEFLEMYEEHREQNSIRLAIVAIKLYDYPKMKYVYKKYFKNKKYVSETQFSDFEMIRIYLEKILEPNKEHRSVLNKYTINQALNYDRKAAIEYIKRHTDQNRKDITLFRSDIDIENLMYKVERLLDDNHDKPIIHHRRECYYISMPQCGHDPDSDENNLNVLKVFTIFNTSNIISMYPTKEGNYDQLVYFEEEPEKKKRLSQIEKFNNRYNLK